jgi:uncharacterized membrane protein YdbT with pleckstrin-like domain
MSYLFHGQRSNEEVLLVSHEHPLVLSKDLFEAVLVFIIPFFLHLFLAWGIFLWVVIGICLVLGGLDLWVDWYEWFNTIYILTNQRVVKLEQKSLLHREFAECDIENIQQVQHEVKGLLETMFDFGEIRVFTGGSQAPFVLDDLPDPYEVQQAILRVAHPEEAEALV